MDLLAVNASKWWASRSRRFYREAEGVYSGTGSVKERATFASGADHA